MWFCHLGKNIDYVVFLVPKYQHVLNSSNNCSCRLEQLYAHFSDPSISMCKLFLCANKVWFFFLHVIEVVGQAQEYKFGLCLFHNLKSVILVFICGTQFKT